jgi:hypothetical protein
LKIRVGLPGRLLIKSGKVLLIPPRCCDKMIQQYEIEEEAEWCKDQERLENSDYGPYIDDLHGR